MAGGVYHNPILPDLAEALQLSTGGHNTKLVPIWKLDAGKFLDVASLYINPALSI